MEELKKLIKSKRSFRFAFEIEGKQYIASRRSEHFPVRYFCWEGERWVSVINPLKDQ